MRNWMRVSIVGLVLLLGGMSGWAEDGGAGIVIETEYVRFVLGTEGGNLHVVDKASGVDYADLTTQPAFARVRAGGVEHGVTEASMREGRL